MEQSNRNQGSTKMAVKIGAGGGIGAVFLLGGALATAALASAFVVGRNGRSSVKDHHRCHKSPPGDDPEYKNTSNGATKELGESDNDTSALDEKPSVEEINTGDIEASEQSLCSIGLEKLETDAISDGSVEEKIHFLDEKLQLDPQDEDVDNGIPEEGQNPEQMRIGGGGAESEPTDEECDGEIKETCRQKAVEGVAEKQPVKVDSGEVLLCYDHEEIKVILVDHNSVDEEVPDDRKEAEENVNGEVVFPESHSEDGPLMDSPAMGHENANVEEKEGQSFPSETVEIVQECEFIEEELLEDGQRTILPVLSTLVVAHENANGDEKEGRPFPTDIVEIKKECEFIEEQLVEDGQKIVLPMLGSLVVEQANGGEKEGHPLPTNTLEIEKECEFIEEQLVEDGQKIILPVLVSLDVEHENTTGDEKEGRPFPTDNVEIVKECEFIEEQSVVEDGQKKIMDVLGNRGVDQEDMNGDKEKAPLPVDTAEMILKDSEFIKGGEEDDAVTNVEDHLAKEQAKCCDADEFIVVRKHDDMIAETGDDIPFDISTVSPMLQEEAISLENVKVTTDYTAMNEEVVDKSTEAIAGIKNSPVIVTATTGDFPVTKIIKDADLTEDSVDETFVSDLVQLTYHQEAEGKILEDKTVQKVECGYEEEVNYSGKALFGKYVTDLAAVNDRLTDSTNRRMMIVTLSAVSSISCSWFFGLSFARLCLVMFLTMVLSSMVVTA